MKRNGLRILCAVLVILTLVSCKKATNLTTVSPVEGFEDWINTCNNSVSGEGEAYYQDGFLYYVYNHDIYEYDLITGKSIQLNKNRLVYPRWIAWGEEGVLFSQLFDSEILELSFETQKQELYAALDVEMFIYWYLEGNTIYGMESQGGDLLRYDKNEKTLSVIDNDVMFYGIEDETLYYICNGVETSLYRKEADKEPVKIELDFSPIKLAVGGDHLVLTCEGEYQLYDYRLSTGEIDIIEADHAESYNCHIFGKYLFYSYWEDYNDGHPIVSIHRYDLEEKEDKVLYENQLEQYFCVFDEESLLIRDIEGKPLLLQIIDDEISIMPLPVNEK